MTSPISGANYRVVFSTLAATLFALCLASCASPHIPQPIKPFPWPPPQASFPTKVLPAWPIGPHMKTLGDIDTKLTAALDLNGYADRSYYSVPGGFALVTRLEQIDPNGKWKNPPDRFSVALLPPSDFVDYIHALFRANRGYYRVVVFIVSDQSFAQGANPASQPVLNTLLYNGINALPPALAAQSLTSQVRSSALIYEFENPGIDNSQQAKLLTPGTMDSVTQLRNAGLWQALQ